ncbi:HyaD/HybD family hydrogenase maturation endopeptidase [Tropicimonas sp. TH_r6]|uniref:HyaD/HybD family hydrogenase maturation endopeptidase n=1 Tax=Tropicimonas sp. TH_r6 TaxID=3082085 RepID=UPI002954028F|nr:HyaD/HybD family hydrogenase maturation endopeptidase [Tropicimonas sp. TH_r6]MDV7145413.1 HyaD/HybD family hydrogenase maturation endopeptidase [Tropicimonas sp. TH_r6]
MARILILGIGNSIMSDEAAGIRALEMFEELHGQRDDVTCIDGGTLSFTLAEPIGAADQLVVFDAAQFHSGAGTVRHLEGEEMDAFVRSGKLSVHEVGLADLFDMSRLSEDLPTHRVLVGIEPETLGWGTDLSPKVAEAIPEAVRLAKATLDAWAAQA